jgi:predicted NAD-dependent protein-ADP-ribosyltransferase YbiA (DUF1768 family)
MKFLSTKPELAERIRKLATPRDALQLATEHIHEQRSDWYEVNVGAMDLVLQSKFNLNSKLASKLLQTGQRDLIENSPVRALLCIRAIVLQTLTPNNPID